MEMMDYITTPIWNLFQLDNKILIFFINVCITEISNYSCRVFYNHFLHKKWLKAQF